MKILTIISLMVNLIGVGGKTYINNAFVNPSNNTGNSSLNNFVQVTYNHEYMEGSSFTLEGGVTVPFVSGTVGADIPVVYTVNINIQLKKYVESANIYLNFKKPSSSTSFNYVCEHCKVLSSSNTTSLSQMIIQVLNSDTATVTLFFTIYQLYTYYGLPYVDIDNLKAQPWITQGTTYFNILTTSYYQTIVLPDDDVDYTTYIDGVEGSLTNIKTYLSTISTNIASIKTSIEDMLSTVNTIEDNQELANNVNKLMYAVNDSYNYKVSIPWNDISVKQWVSAGDYSSRQWVKINEFSGTENIVIRLNDTMGMGDIYYFPVPSNPLADNGRWHDLYVYDYDSNIVKNIRCRVKQITEDGVKNTYFSFDMYEINLTDLSVRHVTESLQQHMYNCKLTEDALTVNQQLLTVNEKLSNIISLLNGYEVGNVIDDDKEHSINTYFNELISGNNLPEYSAPKENFFVLFREFYEPLVNTVNAPVMQNTKFIITFMLAVGLLGVILK